LRREVLTNPDISAIINSDEIQSILKDKKKNSRIHPRQKLNPLKNKKLMDTLNPFQATLRTEKKKKIVKDKNKNKGFKESSKKFKTEIANKIDVRITNDQQRIDEILRVTRLK